MTSLCLLTALALSACSATRPYAIEFTPHYSDYEDSKATSKRAESCISTFLWIFSIGDTSMEGAMQELGGSNAGIKLTYVTVDMVNTNYLVFSTECVRVTGHFVDTNEWPRAGSTSDAPGDAGWGTGSDTGTPPPVEPCPIGEVCNGEEDDCDGEIDPGWRAEPDAPISFSDPSKSYSPLAVGSMAHTIDGK